VTGSKKRDPANAAAKRIDEAAPASCGQVRLMGFHPGPCCTFTSTSFGRIEATTLKYAVGSVLRTRAMVSGPPMAQSAAMSWITDSDS